MLVGELVQALGAAGVAVQLLPDPLGADENRGAGRDGDDSRCDRGGERAAA